MKEDRSSYRQIMKATSLFGGVQVFNIIISIIRSKVIAILLGPAGMGIAGLLTSTTGMIGVMTNFGLRTSAVKDIASAYESGDENRIAKIILIFRRLVWGTGLLGTVLTLVLSPWLSQIAFGNREYTFAFAWLAITLLFSQLTSGQNVLLQGMRKLQYLAKANVFGTAAALIISLPIYYYWRLDGIVPALIITSVFTLGIAWYFTRKVDVKKIDVSLAETRYEGKEMLKMGFMLSLSTLLTMGTAFLLNIFISNRGGVDQVGLYNAGFAIISTYVGLVFTAMSTDYYPRLSGVSHDNEKASMLINQQAEIGLLILAPILSIFFIFINWGIIILYSTQFLAISGMVLWAALGMYFKLASWAIAFILLAKGASRLFFLNELVFNAYMLAFNLLGYYWKGLDGLGISFLLGYFFYLIQVFILSKHKYKFAFTPAAYKIFATQFILGLSCFLIIKLIPTPWAYGIGLPFILVSIWYSYKELDKRIGVKSVIFSYLKK
ncbi:MAG: O-antigen translocase [Bacteroidetes bacterium]|nr:MAG: O-antigen translocase [Bacteroidota bacterium]